MNLVSNLMSYKIADVVDVCERCGILEMLDREPAAAARISDALDLQPDHLGVLLGFAVRSGLLSIDGRAAYNLSPAARQHLPLIRLELWARRWHQENDSLYKVLRTGRRCDPMTGDVSGMRHIYEAAMADAARLIAINIVRLDGLDGAVVVDLGGSDGALAEALLRSKVASRVEVCDRATAEAGFKLRRDASVFAEQMRFHAVDLLRPTGLAGSLADASLVLMSNVVHLLSEAEREAIYVAIRKYAAGAVSLVVYDQFLTEAGPVDGRLTTPDLMVVDWLKCGVPFDYTAERIGAEISRHGFITNVRNAVGLPGRFIVARSPDPSIRP